jgi:hypothetical protein
VLLLLVDATLARRFLEVLAGREYRATARGLE